MARSKQDWQQESTSTPHARPTAVSTRADDNSWRSTPRPLRSRIASQLGLLRIPVYTFIAAGLIWSLIHVVGWLKPVEQPRLTIISSTYRSPMLPPNTFATADAMALINSGLFKAKQASATSQNREAVLASIRGIGQGEPSVFLSQIFGWQRSTDFIYVNTLGIGLPDASGRITPCLLPEDFGPLKPGINESAVPVVELLDAVAASSADHKVVVLDCRRIEQLKLI